MAVPIDPDKLLAAARDSLRGPVLVGRPRSVVLRRAVSSSYYALFHCLTRAGGVKLLPLSAEQQQLRAARTFGHDQMKSACEWVAGRQTPAEHLKQLALGLQQTDMADVAGAFCDLQEARHSADYDHLAAMSKTIARSHINDAEAAIRTFAQARQQERDAFLMLLILRCARKQ